MIRTKTPEKGETRVVDPGVVQQVWEDFAPYRRQAASRQSSSLPIAFR